MGNKIYFLDSGITAQGLADQGFEGIHYFQSMNLHKEASLCEKCSYSELFWSAFSRICVLPKAFGAIV